MPSVGPGPAAHLFAVLFPQQVSEGAVGLLKCAQLLQEKFLLPRQGVDVRAGHLFLLEDSKQSYQAQARREGPAGAGHSGDLRHAGARKPGQEEPWTAPAG